MTELETVKEELGRLDGADKRWILVCAAVALAAIVTGVTAGSILGDTLAFVVTLVAGAMIHAQWQTLGGRRRTRSASEASGGRSATPRAHRATSRRRTQAKK